MELLPQSAGTESVGFLLLIYGIPQPNTCQWMCVFSSNKLIFLLTSSHIKKCWICLFSNRTRNRNVRKCQKWILTFSNIYCNCMSLSSFTQWTISCYVYSCWSRLPRISFSVIVNRKNYILKNAFKYPENKNDWQRKLNWTVKGADWVIPGPHFYRLIACKNNSDYKMSLYWINLVLLSVVIQIILMERFLKESRVYIENEHCRHLSSRQTNANIPWDVDLIINGLHPLPTDPCSYQINEMWSG